MKKRNKGNLSARDSVSQVELRKGIEMMKRQKTIRLNQTGIEAKATTLPME